MINLLNVHTWTRVNMRSCLSKLFVPLSVTSVLFIYIQSFNWKMPSYITSLLSVSVSEELAFSLSAASTWSNLQPTLKQQTLKLLLPVVLFMKIGAAIMWQPQHKKKESHTQARKLHSCLQITLSCTVSYCLTSCR